MHASNIAECLNGYILCQQVNKSACRKVDCTQLCSSETKYKSKSILGKYEKRKAARLIAEFPFWIGFQCKYPAFIIHHIIDVNNILRLNYRIYR